MSLLNQASESDEVATRSDKKQPLGRGFINRLPLATRLIVAVIASTIVGLLLALAFALPMIRDAIQNQEQAQLGELAHATVETVDRGLGDDQISIPDRLVNTLRSQSITVRYLPPGTSDNDLLTYEEMLAVEVFQPVNKYIDTAEGSYLLAARGLNNRGVLVFTKPVSVVDESVNNVLGRVAISMLAGIGCATLLGFWLTRRISGSLRLATQAASRIEQGDRANPLIEDGPQELADLSMALNSLQSALASSEGRQRDFLLSISHELRTPLTAVSGFSEALADGVVVGSDVSRIGELIHDESNRLDRLVSDLMDLARLDAVEFGIAPTDLDFREIGWGATELWSERCSRSQVSFVAEMWNEPIIGRCDPMRLRQIIDNLCENALRVTPEGGTVVLSIKPAAGGTVIIQVRDSGPGLTDSDMSVAFEPGELYSRYEGIRKSGTGVGLALVGRLAQRMGGTASAGSAPEGGACFAVSLPRSS